MTMATDEKRTRDALRVLSGMGGAATSPAADDVLSDPARVALLAYVVGADTVTDDVLFDRVTTFAVLASILRDGDRRTVAAIDREIGA